MVDRFEKRIEGFEANIHKDLQTCASQTDTLLLDTPQEKYCAETVLMNAKGRLENWKFDGILDRLNYFFQANYFTKNRLLENVKQTLTLLSSKNSKSFHFFVHDISMEVFLSPLSFPSDMGLFTIYQGGGPTHYGRGVYDVGPTLDQHITLTFQEWDDITHPLTQRQPGSSPEEREVLGQVVARFEQIAGAKGGTSGDKGGLSGNSVLTVNCDFTGRGLAVACKNEPPSVRRGQQDCVDEYRTLSQLISALQVWGLLQHHTFENEIADAEIKEVFYPHHALIIREKANPENRWIVDSWPRDNGQPPDILPVNAWKTKWSTSGNPGQGQKSGGQKK